MTIFKGRLVKSRLSIHTSAFVSLAFISIYPVICNNFTCFWAWFTSNCQCNRQQTDHLAHSDVKMKSSVENIQSTLITKEENEQVFRLLGVKCQALVTAIVQLYVTQGPDHQNWTKKDSGVMCFVKDNSRRNFFLRLYCLNRNKMIWEQEFYTNFEYKCPDNYFHMFEIDDSIAGLNFASEQEANTMRNTVQEKLALKRQRREERRSRNSLQNKQPNVAINMSSYDTNYKNSQPNSIPYSGGLLSAKKDKKRPIKLTKDDISLPKDFKHISHVGWDPHRGFDVDVDDPHLRKFFDIAGVSDKQLKDKETRDFIYDFISKNGGFDAVNAEVIDTPKNTDIAAPTPPPVPARTAINRTAPPPPPTKVRPPPPQARSQPPPRPEPIQNNQNNNIPVPPPINNIPAPPPPPPPMSAPQPPPLTGIETTAKPSFAPDPRNALFESIRAGKALKPVTEVERKVSVGDSRGDLLHEIRQGIELKPVQNCQRPSSGPSCQENSLAEALSNALKARAFAIHSDSESDSGNSTDDEDEWEQDD